MALISCPDCNSEVSDKAAACPRCGHPISGSPSSAAPVVDDSGNQLSLRARQKYPDITEKIPAAAKGQLLEGEAAIHFAYTAASGGCLSARRAESWVVVTDQRVLFDGQVQSSERRGNSTALTFTRSSGSIPLNKVSYVGTSSHKTQTGCASVSANFLVVHSAGGQLEMVVPTMAEAQRTQAVLESILK